MIILSGSPRRGGNSDTAAALLRDGLTASGVDADLRTVRDGVYRPCVACGFCERHPGRCTLDTPGDDTAKLLADLRSASALLLVLPVFFYGPPAQCKAIMDRAQTFWWLSRAAKTLPPAKPVFMVHIAGRTEGPRLFEANGLIGRCFARTLGFAPPPDSLPKALTGETLPAALCLPGLDGPTALANNSALGERVRSYGQAVGAALARPA